MPIHQMLLSCMHWVQVVTDQCQNPIWSSQTQPGTCAILGQLVQLTAVCSARASSSCIAEAGRRQSAEQRQCYSSRRSGTNGHLAQLTAACSASANSSRIVESGRRQPAGQGDQWWHIAGCYDAVCAGAVPPLVTLLSCQQPAVQKQTAAALGNLAGGDQHSPDSVTTAACSATADSSCSGQSGMRRPAQHRHCHSSRRCATPGQLDQLTAACNASARSRSRELSKLTRGIWHMATSRAR